MAETLVTDFFTLSKLGRVHHCLGPPCFKSGPMDRHEIDA